MDNWHTYRAFEDDANDSSSNQ